MKKWIEETIEKSKKKKGAYSVITVALVLILLLSFTAYTDILSKTFTLNEIQQRLDTAGLNTLNESIDTDHLMLEELAIDKNNRLAKNGGMTSDYKNKISTRYKNQVYKLIRTNDTVKNVTVRRVTPRFEVSSWGTGAGQEVLPQLSIDAVIYFEVATSSEFDIAGTTTQSFYDARSGQNFSVQVVDKNTDGITGLLVRSHTRVVYR